MLTLVANIDAKRASYVCACGNETVVYTSNVTTGHTTSCGCFRREALSARSKTHGHKSGGSRTKVYVAWVNMKSRCNNANRADYANYGGRGISYDQSWANFERFLSDMGEPQAHESIDRIDNNAGYSKGNCRWASRLVQNNNKRNCARQAA